MRANRTEPNRTEPIRNGPPPLFRRHFKLASCGDEEDEDDDDDGGDGYQPTLKACEIARKTRYIMVAHTSCSHSLPGHLPSTLFRLFSTRLAAIIIIHHSLAIRLRPAASSRLLPPLAAFRLAAMLLLLLLMLLPVCLLTC